ncbi:MAG: hypothetical protein PWR10_2382 [Halanaerobiales bacterium]|nr:hypothetical protein [Halanaerobiales bacterium]
MLTPFKENGDVDYEGLETLVAFLRENVDGLFITGSYGSGAMMDVEERKKVLEVTMKTVAGKIPVIVMVGSTNSKTSTELTRHAVEAGVDAISAVGPYYYNHNNDNLIRFYYELLEAAQGKAPVYVYNNPNFQGYEMSLDLMKKFKEIGIHGVKDATFDILTHASYHRVLGNDFDIALGTEAMWLPACSLGTEAFIPGLGNVYPEICRQMYIEGIEGDYQACRKTQFKVNKLRDIMYLARSTQLAVYAMLEIRGILKAFPRSPFVPATEEEKEKIKKELKNLNML